MQAHGRVDGRELIRVRRAVDLFDGHQQSRTLDTYVQLHISVVMCSYQLCPALIDSQTLR